MDELHALYSEVYAEPPYEWGQEHAELFAERFEVQRRQEGFALVEARDGKTKRPASARIRSWRGVFAACGRCWVRTNVG